MRRTILAAMGAMLLASPATAKSPLEGMWTNPKKSLTVRIAPCGNHWCGEVVKASAKQQAKAARNGVPDLIGDRMLDRITPTGPGRWRGRVYVPQLRRHVGSNIVLKGPNQMSVGGCVAGVICKNQVWTRIS